MARITIPDACFTWLAANPHLAPHTRIVYQGEIDRLGQYVAARFGVLAVSELNPPHWEKYLRGMARSRKSVHTRRSEVLKASSLIQAMRISRQFLIWCARTGLLGWWPPKVALPTARQARASQNAVCELPQALRLVLTGESVEGKGPDELRAALAVNLSYWGALDVGDIAALKVLNVVQRGNMVLLAVSGRRVQLPDHVGALWRGYRKLREEKLGAALARQAALIASLEAQTAVRPWSIWAMVKKWQEQQEIEPAFSPRLLRAAFVKSARSREAAGLAASVSHAGVLVARVAAATGDIAAQMRRIQAEELRRLAV